MFAISPDLQITHLLRRPKGSRELELAGWRFLAAHETWDVDARDSLAAATELSSIHPDASAITDQEWWSRYLLAYISGDDVVSAVRKAARPAVGS